VAPGEPGHVTSFAFIQNAGVHKSPSNRPPPRHAESRHGGVRNDDVARAEADRSSHADVRAVWSGGTRALNTTRRTEMNTEGLVFGYRDSRCSIPCLATFACVISAGIQSGLSSGEFDSHAHASYT